MALDHVPTHKEWTAMRDKAGGKSNEVSGVNMGKLLDDYHKAGAGAWSTEAMFKQVRYITPLINGVKKYRAAVAKPKPKLAAVCDEMLDILDKKVKMGAELANPVIKLRQYLEAVIKDSKAVMASGDAAAYDALWSGPVRGVGTSLGPLSKNDKHLANIRKIWHPYTTNDYTAATLTAKIADDDAAIATRLKAAARQLNGLAVKIQSELKSMLVIN